MSLQAAEKIFECLDSIDAQNPVVDRPQIVRAVRDHLRVLEVDRVRDLSPPGSRRPVEYFFNWVSDPDSRSRWEFQLGYLQQNKYRFFGIDRQWAARLGLRSNVLTSYLLRKSARQEPGVPPPARPPRDPWLASDADIELKLRMKWGAIALAPFLHSRIPLLQIPPDQGPRLRKDDQRWWADGHPGRVVPALEHLAEAAAAGLFAIAVCGCTIVLLTRPKLRVENGQLHCWDGRPAVAWEAGEGEKGFYFWRGVSVRDAVGANPEKLDPRRFMTWKNAEVRRVAIERYGYGNFLRDGRAKLVNQDRYGRRWRLNYGKDDVAFVEVVDATPTPEGTHKTYYLRVPPTARSARAAVAWTFGYNRVGDYRPTLET